MAETFTCSCGGNVSEVRIHDNGSSMQFSIPLTRVWTCSNCPDTYPSSATTGFVPAFVCRAPYRMEVFSNEHHENSSVRKNLFGFQ